jgi:hypothetical protein
MEDGRCGKTTVKLDSGFQLCDSLARQTLNEMTVLTATCGTPYQHSVSIFGQSEERRTKNHDIRQKGIQRIRKCCNLGSVEYN